MNKEFQKICPIFLTLEPTVSPVPVPNERGWKDRFRGLRPFFSDLILLSDDIGLAFLQMIEEHPALAHIQGTRKYEGGNEPQVALPPFPN